MPIDNASCSPAAADVMMAHARSHARTVLGRQRVRCFSRNTFINRIQITPTLETPPPRSYYPAPARSDTQHLKLRSRGNEATEWLFHPRARKGHVRLASRCSVLSQSGTATEDRGMKHLLNGVA